MRAMAELRHGQQAWAARPLAERTPIILRFHDLVLAHRDEGLDIVQWETGKARRDGMEELLDVCMTARHYARDAGRLLRPRHHRGVFPGVVAVVQYQHPKGVVGFLAPWNYPLTLAVSDAIPALIAGNAALIKPDVQTSLTTLWVIDLHEGSGRARRTSCGRHGRGSDRRATGRRSRRLRHVHRIHPGRARGRGSLRRATDRLLAGTRRQERDDRAGRRRRPPGGRDRGRACFSNSGQLCISMERIYVHADVYSAFAEAFVARVTAMSMTAGIGWRGDMGSLISARQLSRVQQHVDDAGLAWRPACSGAVRSARRRAVLLRAHRARGRHR